MSKTYFVFFVLYVLVNIGRSQGLSSWETLPTHSGPNPGGRLYHTSVIYHDEKEGDDKIVIFGGRSLLYTASTQPEDRLNDLWKYSLKKNEWVQIYNTTELNTTSLTNVNLVDNTISYSYPFRVLFHAAVVTTNRYMLIYGGEYSNIIDKSQDQLNAVWYYNLDTDICEKNVTIPNGPAEPRRRHSAVYSPLQDAMVIFGGIHLDDNVQPPIDPVDATWKFYVTEQRWERVEQIGPVGRVNHGAAIDPSGRYMYICGGAPKSYYLNIDSLYDLWRLDLVTNEWKELPLMDWKPNGVEAVYLPSSVFWVSTWEALPSNPWKTHHWFDIKKEKWVVDNTKGSVPYGRTGSTMVSLNNNVYVYGGTIEDPQRKYPPEVLKLEYNKPPNHTPLIVGIVVPVGVIILAVAAFFSVKAFRRYRRNQYLLDSTKSVELMSYLAIVDVQIGQQIGGGNFGSVYKGVWQETTQVACKKLNNPERLVDFMKEATTLRSLNHPNIVQFLGIYETPSLEKYIVTEYLSMGNLSRLLSEGKLTEVELLEMCLQIVAGMVYLSEKGLVHRDLALRNVVVTTKEGKYIAKITDFGMAQKVDAGGVYKSYAKDVPIKWCAPEAINKGNYTEKSDVWSFGVAMWEIFSAGALPYPDISNEEVMNKIVTGYRLPAPHGYSTDIYETMLRCWELDEERRPKFKELYEMISTMVNQRRGTHEQNGQVQESRVFMGPITSEYGNGSAYESSAYETKPKGVYENTTYEN